MHHLRARSLLPLAAASLLTLAPAQDTPRQPPHHLVEVAVPDAQALERLQALGLDLVACHGHRTGAGHAEVIATDADLATLRGAGLAFEVAIRDLERHHQEELARHGPFPITLTPPLGQGAMGGHYTFDQMVAILDQLAQDHPALCAPKTSIGKSIEGRDLWMVKISDNVGVEENEPEVLFDALHHAREPLSMETTLLFMDELLSKYGTDPEITYIVDNRELFFVPCVNPDGYEYNRRTNPGGGGMWRKNRRGGYGVDLNRNYATNWGLPGSSGNQNAADYRGAAPFSEPETLAMESFIGSRSFVQVCSSHSYTDVLLTPWGFSRSTPQHFDPYDRVARVATATTGIGYGPFSILLGYLGSGTTVDHHHVAHGALSWTPELGRSNEGGFWPNPTNTVNIATRHQPMFRKIALLSGPRLADAEIVLMSNGVLGTIARIGMLGTRQATAVLAASAGTGNLAVPGVTGNFLLDPATTVWLPGQVFGASGWLTLQFPIPNNQTLSGAMVHWQMLHVGETVLTFGNRETLTLQ